MKFWTKVSLETALFYACGAAGGHAVANGHPVLAAFNAGLTMLAIYLCIRRHKYEGYLWGYADGAKYTLDRLEDKIVKGEFHHGN